MTKFLTAMFVLLLALASLFAAPKGADAAGEYEIKAAMYINILRLVDWPEGKRGDPSSPIVVGVTGSDDMAQALESVAQSKNASARQRITVRRISGTAGLQECHSVFVGGADRKNIEALLRSLGKSPVLTVGENDRFVALGGMIDLTLRDDTVRIEVNLDVVRNGGLTISSQVLKIAVLKTGGK
jgi:hypothetical protein